MDSISAYGSVFVAVLLGVAITGCRPAHSIRQAIRDRRHPLLERAMVWEQSGDLDGAIELYRRIVLQDPQNAEAHFNLALLLHDLRQEYVEAIYHYRVFARLRPQSEKAAIVRDRIRNAERLFRVQLADRVPEEGVAGIDAHTATQLRAARQNLIASEAANQSLRAQIEVANQKLGDMDLEKQAMQRQIDRLERQLAAALRPPDGGVPGNLTGGGLSPAAHPREAPLTYEVRPGDSLTRIAEQVYGDASRWTGIRDANRDKLDAQNRVHPGQILTIP